jgi:hypothetical protein
MIKLRSIALLAPLGLAVAIAVEANPANAALTYYLSDSAGGLVIETSGSLTLPAPLGTSSSCSFMSSGFYYPDGGVVCTGGSGFIPEYRISGPSSITEGFRVVWNSEFTSASGIKTALTPYMNAFSIDSSYIAGQPIVSRSTAAGRTLADLGLTTSSGTLGTWTLGNNVDTISVKVFNPVPGPLPVLGAGAAFGFSRRLRRRIQRSKGAANA